MEKDFGDDRNNESKREDLLALFFGVLLGFLIGIGFFLLSYRTGS